MYNKCIFQFSGKQIAENSPTFVTWEVGKLIWRLVGLVLAILLVVSLVIFILDRHLNPHTTDVDVFEDPGSDRAPFVSGPFLLLYSQPNEAIGFPTQN